MLRCPPLVPRCKLVSFTFFCFWCFLSFLGSSSKPLNRSYTRRSRFILIFGCNHQRTVSAFQWGCTCSGFLRDIWHLKAKESCLMMVNFLVQLQLKLVESTCWVFIRKEFKSCFLHGWNLWCFSTRKQFKSCSHTSCVCQQRSSLKLWCPCIICLSPGKKLKSCGACQCIMCLSTRKP